MECSCKGKRKPPVPRGPVTYNGSKSLCRAFMVLADDSQRNHEVYNPLGSACVLGREKRTCVKSQCQCLCARRLQMLSETMYDKLEALQVAHEIETRQLRCEVTRLKRNVELLTSFPHSMGPRGQELGLVDQLLLQTQTYQEQLKQLKKEKDQAEAKVRHYERMMDAQSALLLGENC
ncbi:uncharacterized protein TM35_000352220 [Trypanosoma theileri]|uniref:Uncharacterized protein n=1 Tax=Trypanosoma theileri TaxID=67003 RepID=A0A1X0NLS1_9TRYP|nr:uncharacterized protein TM35_000352220 [Trypanosoma theileri]ORC85478.1 hypothetical protein TM35_000352220 [Trypanosoma theileri]